MDRNEGIWAQNIQKGVAYDVSAHSGGVLRALMPSGGHFGCPRTPKTSQIRARPGRGVGDIFGPKRHGAAPQLHRAPHKDPMRLFWRVGAPELPIMVAAWSLVFWKPENRGWGDTVGISEGFSAKGAPQGQGGDGYGGPGWGERVGAGVSAINGPPGSIRVVGKNRARQRISKI